MTKFRHFLHRCRKPLLVITILLWATACVLTHLPGNDLPDFHASDTSLHTFGFLGLASWFLLTLAAFDLPRIPRVFVVLLSLAVYAALDERTQPLFGRACEFRDWVNDMIGTAVALVLWESIFLLTLRKRWSTPPVPPASK